MITSLDGFVDALKSDFVTGIATPGSFTPAWANSPFTPTPGAKTVAVDILIGGGDQVEGGVAKRFRYSGEMRVSIYSVVNTGETEANTLADTISARYRAQARAGAMFRVPTTTTIGLSAGRWRIDVVCPFYADLVQ